MVVAGLEGDHLLVLAASEGFRTFCGEEVEGFGGEAVRGGILGGGGEAFGGFATGTELAVGGSGALAVGTGWLGGFRFYDCDLRGLEVVHCEFLNS